MAIVKLTGEIISVKDVFRKNPKNGRITVSRYKLFELDNITRPVLSKSSGPALGDDAIARIHGELYVGSARGLRPVPKKIFY